MSNSNGPLPVNPVGVGVGVGVTEPELPMDKTLQKENKRLKVSVFNNATIIWVDDGILSFRIIGRHQTNGDEDQSHAGGMYEILADEGTAGRTLSRVAEAEQVHQGKLGVGCNHKL